MSRFGRYVPSIEQEVRRAVKEPVAVWRQEWVLPASSVGGVAADAAAASGSTKNDGGLHILKWVKTTATVEFPESEDQEYAGAMDIDQQIGIAAPPAAAALPATVETSSTLTGGAAGGLGSIAPPKDSPAPALPAVSFAADGGAQVAGGDTQQGVEVASALPHHPSQNPSAPTSAEVVAPSPSTADADTTERLLAPSTSAESLAPAPLESRDETPQARPQVAGELHPPPSGLTAEDEAARTDAVATESASGTTNAVEATINADHTEKESALPPPSAGAAEIEARGTVSIEPGTEVRLTEEIRDPEAAATKVGAEDVADAAAPSAREDDVEMIDESAAHVPA